jgi:Sec-independent protein translocase protein TatA
VSTPAIVVVVTVGITSLGALAITLVVLLGHLKRLTGTLRQMQQGLGPSLSKLSEDAQVTQRELGRVTDAAERLRETRER